MGAARGRPRSAVPSTSLGPDSLFFTGSVRKLFSVGAALDALGLGHRFTTPVYRRGRFGRTACSGDLVARGQRRPDARRPDHARGRGRFTDFDHTESTRWAARSSPPRARSPASTLWRGGWLPPASPVQGDVVIDDQLFRHFRVPNGNVLITPVILNDNLIDVTILPTAPAAREGRLAAESGRLHRALAMCRTVAAGGEKGRADARPRAAAPSAAIPVGYRPGLPGVPTLVQTFTHPDPVRLRCAPSSSRRWAVPASPSTRRRSAPNPADRLPAPGPYNSSGARVGGAGLAALCAICPADPQGQPQSRSQSQPDAGRARQGARRSRRRARGGAPAAGARLRAAGRRLRLPDQRQR